MAMARHSWASSAQTSIKGQASIRGDGGLGDSLLKALLDGVLVDVECHGELLHGTPPRLLEHARVVAARLAMGLGSLMRARMVFATRTVSGAPSLSCCLKCVSSRELLRSVKVSTSKIGVAAQEILGVLSRDDGMQAVLLRQGYMRWVSVWPDFALSKIMGCTASSVNPVTVQTPARGG